MAFTFIQRQFASWFINGTSPSLSVTSTGAGNLLVIVIGTPALSSNNFGFPAGWATPVQRASGNTQSTVTYYPNNPGGITSVQVTGVTNTTITNITFFEFSTDRGGASVTKDNIGTNSGTGGTVTASTTFTSTPDLVVGSFSISAYNETGTPTFDAGFTGHVGNHSANGTTADEYSVSTTNTSVTFGPSGSIAGDNWSALLAGFSDGGAAGSFPVGFGHPDGWSAQCQLQQLLGSR